MMERLRQHRDAAVIIESSGGRRMHITMDRYEADWPMVQRGCVPRSRTGACISQCKRHKHYAEDPDIDDQWLPAFVIHDADGPVGRIEDHTRFCSLIFVETARLRFPKRFPSRF